MAKTKSLHQTTETITPDRAFELLEHNTKNRNIRQSLIDRYAREMKAGRWRLNGETIIISDTGRILDGQHRLWAVIEADTPIQTAMAYDVDEDTFDTIDMGATRTAADVFKIGDVTDPALAQGTIKWLWRYTNSRILAKQNCSPKKALELYAECPEIADSYPAGRSVNQFVPKNVGAALHYMFSLVDAPLADTFFKAMASGDFDVGQSAIKACRECIMSRLMKDPKSLPAEDRCAMFIKAWNGYYEGRDLRKIRFAKSEKFPAIKGLNHKKLNLFYDPDVLPSRVGVRPGSKKTRNKNT